VYATTALHNFLSCGENNDNVVLGVEKIISLLGDEDVSAIAVNEEKENMEMSFMREKIANNIWEDYRKKWQ
jgi:hypothetical protein